MTQTPAPLPHAGPPTRIVVCDDHTVVLKGLAHLLALEADLVVVETCTDAAEAVEAVQRFQPDVLLIDYALAGGTCLDAIRSLRERECAVPTIVLSASIDDGALVDMLDQGVRGIVLKDAAPSRLIECVRRVANGVVDVPEALGRRASIARERQEVSSACAESLTDREREIAEEVARGRANKHIASALRISESTVKAHIHSVFRKVGVANRVQLTLWVNENLMT